MDYEDDTEKGFAGLSPEFQAMIGGIEGHTASFAKLLERRAAAAATKKAAAADKDDETYFESYAELAIHEEMLKDEPRCKAYKDAISHYGNEWKASGAAVVDVGAGTGFLSITAAGAGVKEVHAVEASRLAHFLPQIIQDNAQSGCITVHACRAEELDLGKREEVDVIISEWMGYFLLFENMLPSVLAVRDKYLKKGGLMLPSRCRLLLAPMEDAGFRNGKVDFWKQVHGIQMSALTPLAVATACEQPKHVMLSRDVLLATETCILELDLHTAKASDLESFEVDLSFELPAGRRLDGFISWFECEFGTAGWLLSTHPEQPATHWRQTAFYLRQPVETGGGSTVSGTLKVTRHEEFTRGYRVTFDISVPGRKPRLETFELR